MEVEVFIHDVLLARVSLFNHRESYDGRETRERERKRRKKSSCPRASHLQHHDQISTSPTHPLLKLGRQTRIKILKPARTKSHSRSLRDLNNNNNDDHHYPISVRNLVPSGLNCMPYWNIECLEGVLQSPTRPLCRSHQRGYYLCRYSSQMEIRRAIRCRIGLRYEIGKGWSGPCLGLISGQARSWVSASAKCRNDPLLRDEVTMRWNAQFVVCGGQ